MTVPKDARGPVTLSAGTHYRKFTRDYTTFSLGAAHPSLPVTTLASDSVTLPLAGSGPVSRRGRRRGNTDPLWLRWNDYGIGLFLQGDLKGAARGLDEGRGARARQAGRPAQPRARRDRGGPARATRRRRSPRPSGAGRAGARPRSSAPTVAKDEGRLDDAEKDLKAVLEKFPLDRVAWNNLGLVYWLDGKFPEAIAAYGKTLAIDPEDLNAHYNLMRVYRALGRPEERRARTTRRTASTRTTSRSARSPATFRLDNPWANRESLPDPRPRRGRAAAAPRRRLGRRDRAEGLRDRPRLPDARASARAERAAQWSYVTAHRERAVAPSAPRVSSAP